MARCLPSTHFPSHSIQMQPCKTTAVVRHSAFRNALSLEHPREVEDWKYGINSNLCGFMLVPWSSCLVLSNGGLAYCKSVLKHLFKLTKLLKCQINHNS